MAADLFFDEGGQGFVEVGHDPGEQFGDHDADAPLGEGLGHLQADVAGADHEGPPDAPGVQQPPQGHGVLQGPHREDVGVTEAGDGRHGRRTAGGHDEPVVGETGGAPVLDVVHDPGGGIEAGGLGVEAQVDPPPLPEVPRRVGQEVLGPFHQAGQVIGDAAHPVGGVAGRLQDDDLQVGVHAAGGGRGRHARRPAADDDQSTVHRHSFAVGARRYGAGPTSSTPARGQRASRHGPPGAAVSTVPARTVKRRPREENVDVGAP